MKRRGEEQVRGLARYRARRRPAPAAPDRFASRAWVVRTAAGRIRGRPRAFDPGVRMYDGTLDAGDPAAEGADA